MGFKNEEEVQAFTAWAQQHVSSMARHVHTNGVLEGELKGHCVWALPHKIFLGKIWPDGDKSKTYWIISGELVNTDHIEGELADTARDAVRHFSLKWQMQAERLSADFEDSNPDDSNWQEIGENLVSQAEILYAAAQEDRLWDAESQAMNKLLPNESTRTID